MIPIAYRPRLAKPEAAEDDDLKDSIVAGMCLTWDHSFGLMTGDQQNALWRQMAQLYEHNIGPTIKRLQTPASSTPSTSVTIERMSREEALEMIGCADFPFRSSTEINGCLAVLRHLNLIAEPETRLDRFARENGLSEAEKELVRKTIEAGVGE